MTKTNEKERPLRNLEIAIPPRAGHFSTLRLPAKAAKTKLAFRAQTVVFATATLRGQYAPKNMKRLLRAALPGKEAVFFLLRPLSPPARRG